MIFKAVGEARPYPEHGCRTPRDWGVIAPQQVRLDHLITTQRMLDLSTLLHDDSTFYGDLFPHVVRWNGQLYLEEGVHRALRSALQRRQVMYARVLDMDGAEDADLG
jgi:Arc/MetJ family transcription regulator